MILRAFIGLRTRIMFSIPMTLTITEQGRALAHDPISRLRTRGPRGHQLDDALRPLKDPNNTGITEHPQTALRPSCFKVSITPLIVPRSILLIKLNARRTAASFLLDSNPRRPSQHSHVRLDDMSRPHCPKRAFPR